MIAVREYKESDCNEIVELFFNTVHKVNIKDYTEAAVDAWAPNNIDIKKWQSSFFEHYTLVAEINDVIVGFGDIDQTGYLDRLYVHHEYQNMGIATLLCDNLESYVATDITTHASITAKPFFEKRGYIVLKEQVVERKGILLKNFVMVKRLI